MAWYVWGILASVLWGLQYALYGYFVRFASPSLILAAVACGTFPVWLLFAWKDGVLNLKTLQEPKLAIGIPIMVLVSVCANGAIVSSIKLKNPTMAAMLEMSYPFFTALFAYLLFRESHLSWQVALGGLLVLAGVVLILTAAPTHG